MRGEAATSRREAATSRREVAKIVAKRHSLGRLLRLHRMADLDLRKSTSSRSLRLVGDPAGEYVGDCRYAGPKATKGC